MPVAGSYEQNREPIVDAIVGLAPESILDLGCGTGYYGQLIRARMPDVKLDGVEIFPDYKSDLWAHYDSIFIQNLLDGVPPGYDLYLMVDVLEHLPRHEGYHFVRSMPGFVLVSTPWAYEQGEMDGNPWQAHVSQWTLEDFPDAVDMSTPDSLIVLLPG